MTITEQLHNNIIKIINCCCDGLRILNVSIEKTTYTVIKDVLQPFETQALELVVHKRNNPKYSLGKHIFIYWYMIDLSFAELCGADSDFKKRFMDTPTFQDVETIIKCATYGCFDIRPWKKTLTKRERNKNA